MNNFSAIILAAGESRRMGRPKLLLPWGRTTVLGQVVSTFAAAGLKDIIVVTGGAQELITNLVSDLAKSYPVRAVYNPKYASGGMLSSIQTGLTSISTLSRAALIGLGDQPQVLEITVRQICSAFIQTGSLLVIPSFQNQRGHPWLASRSLWSEILSLPTGSTPSQFINNHTDRILYVESDKSILLDLDIPEDYANQRP